MSRRRPDRPFGPNASARRPEDRSEDRGISRTGAEAREEARRPPLAGPDDAPYGVAPADVFTLPRRPLDLSRPDGLQRRCADELGLWLSCTAPGCKRARACTAAPMLCWDAHRTEIQARMQPYRSLLEDRLRRGR